MVICPICRIHEAGCTVCLNGQIMNKEVLIAGNDCTLMR